MHCFCLNDRQWLEQFTMVVDGPPVQDTRAPKVHFQFNVLFFPVAFPAAFKTKITAISVPLN